MTRVIAGSHKGRRLVAPRGDDTRPTADRVKQTLFDILTPRLRGASFLDLCAGSGGIGIEALSRGATCVALVDAAAAAVASIRNNVETLGLRQAEIFRQDALVALRGFARQGRRFDVVYFDPPYASDLYERVLAALAAILADGGVVVAEHFHKRALPQAPGGLVAVREVRVGDHHLTFYEAGGTAAAGPIAEPQP